MCKLAIVPHIPAGKENQVLAFLKQFTKAMTENDSDGFGLMALNGNGLFVQRWLDIDNAWKQPQQNTKTHAELKPFEAMLSVLEPESNQLGKASPRIYCMALHARMATCSIHLDNVHPFVAGKTAIIHNGVISNTSQFNLPSHACDSEAILQSYLNHDVTNNASEIKAVSQDLIGSYAVSVLTQDAQGTWFLDIFKNSATSLYATHIPSLGINLFTTSSTHIELVCNKMKLDYTQPQLVKSGNMVRINAKTGQITGFFEFAETVRPISIVSESRYTDAELDSLSSPLYDDGPMDTLDYMEASTDPFYYRRRKGE